MIRHINYLVVIGIALFTITSCTTEPEVETENPETETTAPIEAKANFEAEEYLDYLDFNDSLAKANSLYYSREFNGNREWIEVVMTLDDSSRILKMVEQYLMGGAEAVYSNNFYFKDGYKYATKQFFIESEGDSSYFVELLSFYDKDENVTATKKRTAEYENDLVNAQYMVAPKQGCSTDRAFDIVNQEGEFRTTFQGFIEMQGFKYLIVGDDDQDGFSTALVVQRTTPLIKELVGNESELLGIPLRVSYQTIVDATGSQQILMGVAREV
ncbi:MAG: hypothetical protein AB8B56_02060 [Crocinitomicaceae bacterium]